MIIIHLQKIARRKDSSRSTYGTNGLPRRLFIYMKPITGAVSLETMLLIDLYLRLIYPSYSG